VTWNYLTDYVFDFEWGFTNKKKKDGEIVEPMPESRVFYTREPNAEKFNQTTAGKRSNWSQKINLYMTDDFLASAATIALEKGNTIVKTDAYMFVSRSNQNEKFVHTYSATYRTAFTKFTEIILPPNEKPVAHSFTVLDASEDQVFLFLENHGAKSPFGNIYVSDEEAHYFSLSLENVIKSKSVDFERVPSLDGTYVANIYDPKADGGSNDKINELEEDGENSAHPKKAVFDQADIVA